MHRVAAVEALLVRSGQKTGTYTASHGMRSADATMLDQAQSAYESGNYKEALRRILRISQPTEASQILAGWADYRLQDMHEARVSFVAALKLNSQSTGAQTGLGYCALRQGDLAEAATHFSAALNESPRDTSALTGMGLTRFRQGRTADAARLLRASLAIDPKNADARTTLARIN
jgi:Flp pilus assembly protein TadD